MEKVHHNKKIVIVNLVNLFWTVNIYSLILSSMIIDQSSKANDPNKHSICSNSLRQSILAEKLVFFYTRELK